MQPRPARQISGRITASRVAVGTAVAYRPPYIHGRPRVAKLSICDGSMVEIALIHPDFRCGVAAVPDGIRWPSSQ